MSAPPPQGPCRNRSTIEAPDGLNDQLIPARVLTTVHTFSAARQRCEIPENRSPSRTADQNASSSWQESLPTGLSPRAASTICGPHGHQGRYQPSDKLQLRQARHPLPAPHPTATGTPLLNVGVQLCVTDPALDPFPELAAGSARQLPGPDGVPRTHATADGRGRCLRTFVESIDLTPRRTVDFLVEQNHRVSQHIEYVIRMEPGVQTSGQTLKLRSGSCRDSTWLLA